MNARRKKNWFAARKPRMSRERSTLRGIESLEARQLMAQLEIRLDALKLDGTPLTSTLSQGQEFLLRGQAKDLRDPQDPTDPGQGPFQVYTDVAYSSSEVTPMVSEVQRLSFTGSPTTGSFSLTYTNAAGSTFTTQDIAFEEQNQGQGQASLIQTALNALPPLAGNVRVEQDVSTGLGLARYRYYIRFINALENQSLKLMTVDDTKLKTDPNDPSATAGATVTLVGHGQRSDTEAFKQAFMYNARTDSINDVTASYPDNRLGADKPDLFDNVGGGAPLFSPPGTGLTTYFVIRLKAGDPGSDGQLVFTNGSSGDSNLPTVLFGQAGALPDSEIKYTYGTNGTDLTSLKLPVSMNVKAVADTYTVVEDSAAAVFATSPLANDTQTPATPRTLVITAVSAGDQGGTLTIVNNGANVSYKPAANFFGTEKFTYTVSDGKGGTATGNITVNVTAVNDPPSFTVPASVSRPEDAPLQTIANFVTNISAGPGESGQTLTFTTTNNNNSLFAVQPSVASNGTLTFRPAADKSGQATVTLQVKDNGGGTDTTTKTFVIQITAVNDAPINHVPGAQSTTDQTPVVFQAPGSAISITDVDAGSGDVKTTLGVTSGKLTIGGTIGAGLIVTGNGTSTVVLTGTVAEINTAISKITYIANAGFSGNDTLTMTTDDQGHTGSGGALVDTDTITITVNTNQNNLPTAVADSASMAEDGPAITIDVLQNDSVHNQSSPVLLSFTQPAGGAGTVTLDDNGTPTKTDDRVVFKPALNFNGTATFSYTMNDTNGTGNNSTANVSVRVTPVNDPPSATDKQYATEEDVVLNVAAPGLLQGATDPDGDTPLKAAVVAQPQHGSVTVNVDGSFQYTPAANFNGSDSFTYRVSDPSNAQSAVKTVSLTVSPVPDRPTGTNKSYTTAEDTTLTIGIATGLLQGANDVDGGQLSAVIKSQPTKGTLTAQADGSFTYVPKANANGADSFTFVVRDPQGYVSDVKTASITITPINDAPIAFDDSGYTTSRGTTLNVGFANRVLANDKDVDGDPLTAVLATQAPHGTVTLRADGTFTYVPAAGYTGPDSFTYVAKDNSGAANNTSSPATVSITVNAVNQAPSATPHSYATNEDTNLVITATNGLLVGASDPEGSQLTASVVNPPTHGVITAFNGNGAFTYRPNANFNGTDTFTFKVNDGQLDSAVQTVTIRVAAVNDPPPVVNDSFNVSANTADQLLGDVLANDRAAPNPDGNETLSLAGFASSTAQGGTIRLDNNGRFRYTPKAGFTGSDSFTYQVTDGQATSTATVTLNVQPAQLSVISGFVFSTERDGGARHGVANVTVRLVGVNNNTSLTTATRADGSYSFGQLQPGTYRLVEVQPRYLTDGQETVGNAGGTAGNDNISFVVPAGGFAGGFATGYNFNEGDLIVGQNPNGDPPLQLTPQEIMASNTHLGAEIALSGTQQSWFTTLDPSWKNVVSMTVQVADDLSSMYVRIVVRQNGAEQTYEKTVLQNPQNTEELRFRVMATNNAGFRVMRLDGDLDLTEWNAVAVTAQGADAAFANW